MSYTKHFALFCLARVFLSAAKRCAYHAQISFEEMLEHDRVMNALTREIKVFWINPETQSDSVH